MLATAYNIPGSFGINQTLTNETFGGAWTTQPSSYQISFNQPLTATNLNSVVDPYSGLNNSPMMSSGIGGQFFSMPMTSGAAFPLYSYECGPFNQLNYAGQSAPSFGFGQGVSPLNGFGYNPYMGTPSALQPGMFGGMYSNSFGRGAYSGSLRYVENNMETIIELSAPTIGGGNSEIVVFGNEIRIRTPLQRSGADLSRPFFSVPLPLYSDINRIQTISSPNGTLTIRVPRQGNAFNNFRNIQVA